MVEITQLTELETQIRLVAEVRRHNEALRYRKAKVFAEWEAQNEDLLFSVGKNTEFLNEEETRLRDLTLEVYLETGNKAPAPGVSVKIFQTLAYDPKDALTWAMSHQVALSLDKKTFERFAASTPLDFVTVNEEARAQISQDLSKIVEEVK